MNQPGCEYEWPSSNNNNNNNNNNKNSNSNNSISNNNNKTLTFLFREVFDMSKDDHDVKNKDGALNSKAKQYSDSGSDEYVKLSGKYLDR